MSLFQSRLTNHKNQFIHTHTQVKKKNAATKTKLLIIDIHSRFLCSHMFLFKHMLLCFFSQINKILKQATQFTKIKKKKKKMRIQQNKKQHTKHSSVIN